MTVRKHLRLALAGATVERHELPLQLRLLDVLLDPNLITLLFLGGILGIAFELTHPGIVLPGLLGGVALLLALLGLSIVPFSWAGVALLAFGIALLGARGARARRTARSPASGALSLLLGGVHAVPRRRLALRHDELLARARASPARSALIAMFVVSRGSGRRAACRRAAGGVTLVGELATVVTALAPARPGARSTASAGRRDSPAGSAEAGEQRARHRSARPRARRRARARRQSPARRRRMPA